MLSDCEIVHREWAGTGRMPVGSGLRSKFCLAYKQVTGILFLVQRASRTRRTVTSHPPVPLPSPSLSVTHTHAPISLPLSIHCLVPPPAPSDLSTLFISEGMWACGVPLSRFAQRPRQQLTVTDTLQPSRHGPCRGQLSVVSAFTPRPSHQGPLSSLTPRQEPLSVVWGTRQAPPTLYACATTRTHSCTRTRVYTRRRGGGESGATRS